MKLYLALTFLLFPALCSSLEQTGLDEIEDRSLAYDYSPKYLKLVADDKNHLNVHKFPLGECEGKS